MPEAIPVPESIQLDYARKHSTGTRQKVFHWNASQSIPLENTPKSFDWYMLENTPVSESIPLECARKQSAGICLKAFHWKTSESISLRNTRKHSTGIYQKAFQRNTPESIAWISNLHKRWKTPESIPLISSLYKSNWKKRTRTRPKTLNNRLRKAPKEFPKAFHQDSPKRIQLIYTRKKNAARKHSTGICLKAFHENALVSIRLEYTRKHTSGIRPKAWHGFQICTGGGKRPKAFHGFQVCTKGIEKKNKLYKSCWKKGPKSNQKHQIMDSEKPQKNQNASQNDTWAPY